MITHVHIQNFRSFLDAKVDLQPFSLVVGANGSGKTNFLRFFEVISQRKLGELMLGHRVASVGERPVLPWVEHSNRDNGHFGFRVEGKGFEPFWTEVKDGNADWMPGRAPWTGRIQGLYNLVPDEISGVEEVQPFAEVEPTGAGVTQVLDLLKNGDREDLFVAIEDNFKRYVPEVEKLSLNTIKQGYKQIQIREKGLKNPTPGPELSEGTRLILAILTILHQEKPPPIILLEDIDRGMHPRLFEYMAPLMKDIAVRMDVNIIATTHNPYLVDAFQDDKKAVIIVEKEDGASTLTTLEDKLEGLNYDEVNPDDLPLGQLWYSGLVGGVPKKIDLATKG